MSKDERTPLECEIDEVVRCVRCSRTREECDCYVTCSCGWYCVKGEACNNTECGGDGSLSPIFLSPVAKEELSDD